MRGAVRCAAAFCAAAFSLSASLASAADLYGKPLRGLTAVPVASVVADPGKYAAKTIRVEGKNSGPAGKPALKDGEAVLPIEPDGFKVPADFEGGSLSAEGRAASREGRAVFVATGLEVRR